MKAVALVSGGLDSCVALAMAKEEGLEVVEGLNIYYGQKHFREAKSSFDVCIHYNVTHMSLDLGRLKPFIARATALINPDEELPKDRALSAMTARVPRSYVPGRNTIMLALAQSIAEVADARRIVVGFNAVDFCIAGDSLIDVVDRDGKVFPEGIPIKDLVGTKPLVYTYDHTEGKVIIGQAYRVAPTGRFEKVVRVTYRWKNGRGRSAKGWKEDSLVTTPDHKWMLRDGGYCAASNLLPGTRLMPMNSSRIGGGRRYVSLNSGKQVRQSVLVYETFYGSVPEGYDIHHLDENPAHDALENLEARFGSEHRSYHSKKANPMEDHTNREKVRQSKIQYWRELKKVPELLAARNSSVSGATIAAGASKGDKNVSKRPEIKLKQRFAAALRYGNLPLAQGLMESASSNLLPYLAENLERFYQGKYPSRFDNHEVVSVEFLDVLVPTYNLGVQGTRNFAVNGVFVRNSGYPDCRPIFVSAWNHLARYATRAGYEQNDPIEVFAPIINKSKASVVAEGIRLGAPLELTTSCYEGREKACGRCDSCRIRRDAFRENKMDDPIPYEE